MKKTTQNTTPATNTGMGSAHQAPNHIAAHHMTPQKMAEMKKQNMAVHPSDIKPCQK